MAFFRLFLVLLATLAFCNTNHAQDNFDRWAIGLGINAVHNPISGVEDPVRGIPIEKGRYETWNMSNTGFRFTASRYIDYGFVFESVFSSNKVTDTYTNTELPYFSVDGIIRHNLNPRKRRVSPYNFYVGLGGGYTWLNKIGAGTVNGTAGINFWIHKNFGFNVQSTVKKTFKDYGIDHFQHSVGVVYRFVKNDSDNDGVPNREDECPGVRGSIDLKGCPDKDGDGIKDEEDACPNAAGLPEYGGCPDTDGDGIPDNNDTCPEVAGLITNAGCPIPDTDRDGILDDEDKCPNEAGPLSNNGCPEITITEEDEAKINVFARTLLFTYGKETLRDSDKASLDEILVIMETYPKSKFYIDGHTDDTSGANHNLKLSRKRANSVKQYLVENGIDASRLRARGFGESRPIAPNNSKEGRRMNRRVEIILIN